MYYCIDDETFETKEDAFDHFLDVFDFTDGLNLNELCEKMEYTKEELLGTLLSLTLRNETFDNLDDRVLNAIEEIFQEEVIEEDSENEEEEEEENGD